MKKLILFLALVSGMLASAQQGYGGLYYSDNPIPRPYVYTTFNLSKSSNVETRSVLGLGFNYNQYLNITIGGDVVFGKRLVKPLIGLGVRFVGYSNYYQEYMPDVRLGFEIGRFIILSSINWDFNHNLIDPPFGYSGLSVSKFDNTKIVAYEPQLKPTIGIFYKF